MTRAEELITDFLDTLTGLATGSYLRTEEREHWEAPYPPEAAGEAGEILHRLADEVRQDPAEISLAVISSYGAFTALNERYGGALIEPEEEEDIRGIITALATDYDQDAEAVLADLDRILEQEN